MLCCDMIKLKINELYYVEWTDTIDVALSTETGEQAIWLKRKTINNFTPLKIESVGLLVVDRKDYIILASNFDLKNDEMSHSQLIPKGIITYIERLYCKSYPNKRSDK